MCRRPRRTRWEAARRWAVGKGSSRTGGLRLALSPIKGIGDRGGSWSAWDRGRGPGTPRGTGSPFSKRESHDPGKNTNYVMPTRPSSPVTRAPPFGHGRLPQKREPTSNEEQGPAETESLRRSAPAESRLPPSKTEKNPRRAPKKGQARTTIGRAPRGTTQTKTNRQPSTSGAFRAGRLREHDFRTAVSGAGMLRNDRAQRTSTELKAGGTTAELSSRIPFRTGAARVPRPPQKERAGTTDTETGRETKNDGDPPSNIG